MSWLKSLKLTYFGWRYVPLIFYCRPRIITLNNTVCQIKIPLRKRTKNHLNSMYFGALCIGSDLASGLLALELIDQSKSKIAIIFKDVNAQFLKRAEDDVIFTCTQGNEILKAIQQTSDGNRHHTPVTITATVPTLLGDEPVATFQLTLSLKQTP